VPPGPAAVELLRTNPNNPAVEPLEYYNLFVLTICSVKESAVSGPGAKLVVVGLVGELIGVVGVAGPRPGAQVMGQVGQDVRQVGAAAGLGVPLAGFWEPS